MRLFSYISNIINSIMGRQPEEQEQDWKKDVAAAIISEVRNPSLDMGKTQELEVSLQNGERRIRGFFTCAAVSNPFAEKNVEKVYCAAITTPENIFASTMQFLDENASKGVRAAVASVPKDRALAPEVQGGFDLTRLPVGVTPGKSGVPELHACVASIATDTVSSGRSNGNPLTGSTQGSFLLAGISVPDAIATRVPANPNRLVALNGQEAVNAGHGLVVDNGASKGGGKTV